MGKAAHGGALGGRAAGVVGINLDQVAKAIDLVTPVLQPALGRGGDVEAGKFALLLGRITGGRFPLVAARLGLHAHPLLRSGLLAGVDKAGGPVLFGRDVGAPRGRAIAAVVVGAAHLAAGGRERRLDPVGARHRAGQVHRRGRGKAAVVAGVVDDLPFAALLAHMHDGNAMGIDFLAHLFCRALASHRRGAVRVQGLFVDVLVVDHQQAFAGAARQRKVVHAVMVHAGGVQQVLRGVAAFVAPGRCLVVERRTPGTNDRSHITGGHDAGVRHRVGQRGKAQLDGLVVVAIAAATAGGDAGTGKQRQGRAQAAAHHQAPRHMRFENGAERGVVARVTDDFVGYGFAHRFDSPDCWTTVGKAQSRKRK